MPWWGPLNGRTSNAVWPSPGPFYRTYWNISFRGCAGGPQPSLWVSSRAYSSSIRFPACASASSAFTLISLAALRSRYSTVARSLSSARCLSRARVHSYSYRWCCCLSLSPAYLALSTPYLLWPLFSSSKFTLLRGRSAHSLRGGRGAGRWRPRIECRTCPCCASVSPDLCSFGSGNST